MRLFLAVAGTLFVASTLVAGAAFSAPRRSGPDVRPVVVPAADKQSVEDGNLAFALASYRELAATPGNVAYSPLGASTVLAMTMAGARGETREQLAGALGLTLPADRADAAFQSVLADLRPRNAGVVLDIADGLFLSRDFAFRPGYVSLLKRRYGAQASPFADAPDAVSQVNRWAARRTRGMVPAALDTVDPATVALLANVVYLDAKWAHPFDPSRTQDGRFTRADGTATTVPMMHLTDDVSVYAEYEPYGQTPAPDSAVQVAEFPYKDRDWSMLVVVPKAADALPAVEARMDAATLKGWIDGLETRFEVAVSMPRFELSAKIDLVPTLQALGVSDVFDANGSADLSGAGGSPGELFLGLLTQTTKIRVRERGTQAAAVTIGGMQLLSMPYSLSLDRPFLFLIRHRPSGTILFMGRVADPSAAPQ